jgi:hypothetical protein
MEELIKETAEKFYKGDSQLTSSAILIADCALRTYTGVLLDKALEISKAIIAYEDALKQVVK